MSGTGDGFLITTKTKHETQSYPSPKSTPVILVLVGLGGRVVLLTSMTPPTSIAEVIFCMIQFFLNSDDETGDEFVTGISQNLFSEIK